MEPKRFASVCGITKPWLLNLPENGLLDLAYNEKRHALPLCNVQLDIVRGSVFSTILVNFKGERLCELKGASHEEAENFQKRFNQLRRQQLNTRYLEKKSHLIVKLKDQITAALQRDKFINSEELNMLREHFMSAEADVERCYELVKEKALKDTDVAQELRGPVSAVYNFLINTQKIVDARNMAYINSELERWAFLFDNALANRMNRNQRVACIQGESTVLTCAATGTGKTQVMLVRALYLLAKGACAPEKILVLCQSAIAVQSARQQAVEIAKRIIKHAPRAEDLLASSFGTLSQREKLSKVSDTGIFKMESSLHDALSECSVKRLNICSVDTLCFSYMNRYYKRANPASTCSAKRYEREDLHQLLDECLRQRDFANHWIKFHALYRFPLPEDNRFTTEFDYNAYFKALFSDNNPHAGVLGLNKVVVAKSYDELVISNWLYIHGIDHEAHRVYEEARHSINGVKEWRPAFTYKLANGETIIHEHFCLNKDGRAPAYLDNATRHEDICAQKIKTLNTTNENYGTHHFHTTRAELRNGTLFDQLHERLSALGVEVKMRHPTEVMPKLRYFDKSGFLALLARTVEQVRSDPNFPASLESRLARQRFYQRGSSFVAIVRGLAARLNDKLEAKHIVDANQFYSRLIKCNQDHHTLPLQQSNIFSHILVDDFQEMLPKHVSLLDQVLLNNSKAIFYVNSNEHMRSNNNHGGNADATQQITDVLSADQVKAIKKLSLLENYRTPIGITRIAAKFLRDRLNDAEDKPVSARGHKQMFSGIEIHSYSGLDDIFTRTDKVLSKYRLDANKHAAPPSLMVIGRHPSNALDAVTAACVKHIDKKWSMSFSKAFAPLQEAKAQAKTASLNSFYCTAAQAKGFEADYVIMLGMFAPHLNYQSFPAERRYDELSKLSHSYDAVNEADEDEYRLFYSSITRSKRKLALFAHDYYPSRFVTMLMRDNVDSIIHYNNSDELPTPCPHCTDGVFKKIAKKSGGFLYACTDKERCGKTQSHISITEKWTALEVY